MWVCWIVIELKTGEFKPEYAEQLNFYLSAVDGILKKDADNRFATLQEQERFGSRVCSEGYVEANWGQRIQGYKQPAGRFE